MKRIQIQANVGGWEIASIKERNGNVIAIFKKEKENVNDFKDNKI